MQECIPQACPFDRQALLRNDAKCKSGGCIGARKGSVCRLILAPGSSKQVLDNKLTGEQVIYYLAKDTSNNVNIAFRTIELVDNRPPEIRVQRQEECALPPRRLPPPLGDRTCVKQGSATNPDWPYCRPSWCWGVETDKNSGGKLRQLSNVGCFNTRGTAPCDMDRAGKGKITSAEVTPAGGKQNLQGQWEGYTDMGAIGFDEVDLSYTIDALGRVIGIDGIHSTGSKKGDLKVGPTVLTRAGYGPLANPARVNAGDFAGNCQKQPEITNFWQKDPNFEGQCLGTLRMHNPVIEFPSVETVPSLPKQFDVRFKLSDLSFNERPKLGASYPDPNFNNDLFDDPKRYRRSVKVQDKVLPDLKLCGGKICDGSATGTELEHEGGTPYITAFAVAQDRVDGDITAKVVESVVRQGSLANCKKKRGCKVQDRVDIYAPHDTPFQVTYSVADRSGNRVTKRRTVKVVDTTPPVITLTGSQALDKTKYSIECTTPELCGVEGGTTWVDPGASATDLLDDDDDVTNKVAPECVNCQELRDLKVSSSKDAIDTDAKAFTKYEISYNVKDAAGNAAKPVVRYVEIRDSTKPVITVSPPSEQIETASDYTADVGVAASDTLDGTYAMFPRYGEILGPVAHTLTWVVRPIGMVCMVLHI